MSARLAVLASPTRAGVGLDRQPNGVPLGATHSRQPAWRGGLFQGCCGHPCPPGGFSQDDQEAALHRHALAPGADRAAGRAAPPIVQDALRTPGRPLDAVTRAVLEPRFGHDFSRVRVHVDAKAARSAQAVDALAYTVGEHIVFGAGQYAPGASGGLRLLAHELTHVVQHAGGDPAGRMRRAGTDLLVSRPSDRSEREAEAVAFETVASGRGSLTASTPGERRETPRVTTLDPTDAPGLQRRALPSFPGTKIAELSYTGTRKPRVISATSELVPEGEKPGAFVGFKTQKEAETLGASAQTTMAVVIRDGDKQYHVFDVDLAHFSEVIGHQTIETYVTTGRGYEFMSWVNLFMAVPTETQPEVTPPKAPTVGPGGKLGPAFLGHIGDAPIVKIPEKHEPTAGWEVTARFDDLPQLDLLLADASNAGPIPKLGVLAHGDHPGVINIGSTLVDIDQPETIEATRARLTGLGHYLTADADVYIFGCISGKGRQGSALLSELSQMLPGRRIIGFTKITAVEPSGLPVPPHIKMTDIESTALRGKIGFKEAATDTASTAKIARDGKIVKWPTDESKEKEDQALGLTYGAQQAQAVQAAIKELMFELSRGTISSSAGAKAINAEVEAVRKLVSGFAGLVESTPTEAKRAARVEAIAPKVTPADKERLLAGAFDSASTFLPQYEAALYVMLLLYYTQVTGKPYPIKGLDVQKILDDVTAGRALPPSKGSSLQQMEVAEDLWLHYQNQPAKYPIKGTSSSGTAMSRDEKLDYHALLAAKAGEIETWVLANLAILRKENFGKLFSS
jgi:hypothetical protein